MGEEHVAPGGGGGEGHGFAAEEGQGVGKGKLYGLESAWGKVARHGEGVGWDGVAPLQGGEFGAGVDGLQLLFKGVDEGGMSRGEGAH